MENNTNVTETNNVNSGAEEMLTISQKAYDEALAMERQREGDKVRGKYVQINKGLEADKQALQTKIDELTEQINSLTPPTKSEQELALEAREAEIAAKERLLAYKEAGINDDFAKYINNNVDIKEFSDSLNKMIDEKANQKIIEGGYKPKSPLGGGLEDLNKDSFKSMNYQERAKIYTDNPSLYAELSN